MKYPIQWKCLPTWLLLIGSLACALAQTEPNPPPGIPVPAEIGHELEAQTAKLKKSIEEIRATNRKNPEVLDLLSDVIIYYNAVKKHYRINPNRISVRGFSMGGAVTWHMATHHAGLWSAASPGAGFAESAIYAKVMEKDPKPAWYELKLHNLYDATKYAANLAQCPTIAYSGSIDPQKQAADIMSEYMKAEGMDLLHIIGEGMGHKFDDVSLKIINDTVDKWTRVPKDPFPKKIQFVTYSLPTIP